MGGKGVPSERWNPLEIGSSPGTNSSVALGVGWRDPGKAACEAGEGSGAMLNDYLDVSRLGTSLHKAQRGTAEKWKRKSF